MQFSVLFFSQVERSGAGNPYRLLTDCARFCDARGFKAVWLPERHFDAMGGLYPDPAVAAAFLASQTTAIRLRAGSVVLPLHHPAAVVEAWAMVDQLSSGRVDVAFASGWSASDFVLAPAAYRDHRREWLDRIPVVRALWEGKAVELPDGEGKPVRVSVHPRPVQRELPCWLAISRRVDSFQLAGAMGLNVLTMLSGISLDQLGERAAVYREARRGAGLDPASGVVTLMLHTYVHRTVETVRDAVRQPLLEYLKRSAASHLRGGAVSLGRPVTAQQVDQLAEYSLERYFNAGSLFGDLAAARAMVARARAAGVDEIACMMDFGLTHEQVQEGLPHLAELKDQCAGV